MPSAGTIGTRLRTERLRLGLSQTALARLADASKSAVQAWERGAAYPNAAALADFAAADADVLFIVTGRHTPVSITTFGPAMRTDAYQALACLPAADRHRLLLDLLADELRASTPATSSTFAAGTLPDADASTGKAAPAGNSR